MLEGSGNLHLGEDPDEERHGVAGELLEGVLGECGKVDLAPREDDDGGHAGAPVGAGDRDAIDVCLLDAREDRDGLGDLVRRHVLALPAERVTDAIGKVEKVVLPLEEVTRPEVAVALDKDVGRDLLVRAALVGVIASKLAHRIRIVDESEELAHLAILALDAQAVRTANQLLRLNVELDDPHRVQLAAEHEQRQKKPQAKVSTGAKKRNEERWVPHQRAEMPDGPAALADERNAIEETGVAFGRGVKLADLWDAKARLELFPDVRAKAVADGDAQIVLVLAGDRVGREEVAAELADVLEHGRLALDNVLHEVLGAELGPKNHGRATVDDEAHADDARGRVVERQHRVAAVRRADVVQVAEDGRGNCTSRDEKKKMKKRTKGRRNGLRKRR